MGAAVCGTGTTRGEGAMGGGAVMMTGGEPGITGPLMTPAPSQHAGSHQSCAARQRGNKR